MYETYPASILPPVRVRHAETPRIQVLHEFLSDAQLLLDIFTFNSFALNMTISEVQEGSGQKSAMLVNSKTTKAKSTDSENTGLIAIVRSQLPANLWSLQALRLRGDSPTNDFDIKMLDAFARKTGVSFEWLSTSVKNDIDVSHMIRIT